MLLHVIFATVSLVSTALQYIANPTLSVWWALVLLPATYTAAFVLSLLILLGISLLLPRKETSVCRAGCRYTILCWLEWLLPILGVKSNVTGLEKLPAEPFLLVCNHVSNFDPMVTLLALKHTPLAFVSKPENFRLPAVGPFIRNAAFLSIDRENPRRALTSIHRAAEYIQTDKLCIGIYPEGTRSKNAQLLPFHHGSFKIAKLAACPVAVLSIRYEAAGRLFRRRVAHLTVETVLDTSFVAANQTATISDHARQHIETGLNKQ